MNLDQLLKILKVITIRDVALTKRIDKQKQFFMRCIYFFVETTVLFQP